MANKNETTVVISAVDKTQAAFRSVREGLEQIEKSASGLDNLATRLPLIGTALAAALGGASFSAIIKDTIDFADHLNDLSHSTGVSVEDLARFKLAAEQSGTSLDDVARGVGKLSKAMIENSDRFKAAGISTTDATTALLQLSDVFAGLEDGPKKTALAIKLFGKAGADLIPLLNDGSKALSEQLSQSDALAKKYAELAPKADAFNDKLAKLKTYGESFAVSVANPVVDGLDAIAEALDKAAQKGPGALAALSAQIGVAGVGALGKKLLPAPLAIAADLAAGAAFNSLQGRDDTNQAGRISGGTVKAVPAPKKNAADLLLDGTDAKAKLANQLKSLEAYVAAENAILAARNRALDLYNSENLLSFNDYFRARKQALDQDVAASSRAYDQEIALLRKSQQNAKDATEREEAQGKINDLLEKKKKLQLDAANQTFELSFAEQKALRDYQDAIDKVDAQLLQLTGHLREAALINFDQQNRALRDRFVAEGNQSGLDKLNQLRAFTGAQAEANKLSEDAQIIQDKLANTEERIQLAQQLGATSELQGLQQTSAARRQAAAELENLVINYEAVAKASGNPKLIQDADKLRLELEKLQSASDLVAQKFNTVFSDSFSSAFADFVTRSKSASDAFRSFADSVVQQISRLAAQDLASKIFGGGNGGIGGILSGLFGGAGGAAKATAPATGSVADSGFDLLLSAKGNVFNSPGGLHHYVNSILSSPTLFRFAKGGAFGLAGEAGPEAVMPLTRDASGRLGVRAQQVGGQRPVQVVNNFHFTSPQDPRTQQQLAAVGGMAVQRALARNT